MSQARNKGSVSRCACRAAYPSGRRHPTSIRRGHRRYRGRPTSAAPADRAAGYPSAHPPGGRR
jgi:hypothetical protein